MSRNGCLVASCGSTSRRIRTRISSTWCVGPYSISRNPLTLLSCLALQTDLRISIHTRSYMEISRECVSRLIPHNLFDQNELSRTSSSTHLEMHESRTLVSQASSGIPAQLGVVLTSTATLRDGPHLRFFGEPRSPARNPTYTRLGWLYLR